MNESIESDSESKTLSKASNSLFGDEENGTSEVVHAQKRDPNSSNVDSDSSSEPNNTNSSSPLANAMRPTVACLLATDLE